MKRTCVFFVLLSLAALGAVACLDGGESEIECIEGFCATPDEHAALAEHNADLAAETPDPGGAPWPVFVLPQAPPNPTLIMEYYSGGSCGKTSNPNKWRVCATAPGTDPDVATACIDPAETIYGTHSTHSTGCCACTDAYGRCGSRGSCVAWGRVGQFVLTAGAESPFMDKCRCELIWSGTPPVASRSCGSDWDPNGHDPGPNGVCNDGDDSYIPQDSYPPDPPAP